MPSSDYQRLLDRIIESEKDITDLKLIGTKLGEEINSLRQSKVSYKMFWIIVGSLVTAVLALLSVIYSQNQQLSEKMGAVQQDVSYIQGSMNQLLNKASITSAKE